MRYSGKSLGAEENGKALEACKDHDFSIVTAKTQLGTPLLLRCRKCGGEVDINAKQWYEIGREHAAGANVTGTITNTEG